MKFALIAPLWASTLVLQYRLSYHMVLSQYAGDDSDYVRFYARAHERGDFIIVDNGAAEHAGLPFGQVLAAAERVDADEICMPDVLDDGPATARATWDAAHFVPPCKRMLIPQGKTWGEWSACLQQLEEIGGRSIGIAKRYEALAGGRAHALRLIHDLGLTRKYDIHLLGFYEDPLRELSHIKAMQMPVRGVDSGAPIAYAQHSMALHSGHASLDWDAPIPLERIELNLEAILACM